MAAWFHLSVLCKGKASVASLRWPDEGLQNPKNTPGINERNSGYAQLAFCTM